MNLAVFGTGKVYASCKHLLEKHRIVCLLDNDAGKQGTQIDGIRVIAPEAVRNVSFDRICILTDKYYEEIRHQLISLGVEAGRLLSVHDVSFLDGRKAVFVPLQQQAPDAGKKALVVTNGLSLTGAPLAAFYAVRFLAKHGYAVTVVSPEDGPLKDEYACLPCDVMLCRDLFAYSLQFLPDIEEQSLVLINTVTFYYLLKHRDKRQRVIWWIHEASEFYQAVPPSWARAVDLEHVDVYAVSGIAKENFQRIWKRDAGLLRYGLMNLAAQPAKEHSASRGLVFAFVGTITKRKGVDVLLEAIGKLPESYRERCMFLIAGNLPPAQAMTWEREMVERLQGVSRLKLCGLLTRGEMAAFYQDIDVLICPSREDPLPMVVTEAMMYGKPVVMSSSGIGQAEEVTDRRNGLLFRNGDAGALCDCMKWAIDHKAELPQIGAEGRKIFEAKFSQASFERSMQRILDDDG